MSPDTIALHADSTAAQAAALERIARALEALVFHHLPEAPNYRRELADFLSFDWGSIGAEVTRRDEHGPAVIRWGAFYWTRRSPQNKFGKAVWFSRASGREPDGNPRYVRLITFADATDPEPMPRAVAQAVSN